MAGLKKKVGPLPMWAWIMILGGTAGVIWLYHSNSSSSSSTSSTNNQVDPSNPLGLTYAQESADIAAGIDPNTGQTYASENAADNSAAAGNSGGGGGDGSGDTSSGDQSIPGTGASDTGSTSDDLSNALNVLGELGQAGFVYDPTGQLTGGYSDISTGQGTDPLQAGPLHISKLLDTPTPAAQSRAIQTPKATVAGASIIGVQHNKPQVGRDQTVKGLGNGWWEVYTTKPTAPPKTTPTATGNSGKTSEPPKKTTVSGNKHKPKPTPAGGFR